MCVWERDSHRMCMDRLEDSCLCEPLCSITIIVGKQQQTHTQCNQKEKNWRKKQWPICCGSRFVRSFVHSHHSINWPHEQAIDSRSLRALCRKKMIKKQKRGAHNTHYTSTWLTLSICLFVFDFGFGLVRVLAFRSRFASSIKSIVSHNNKKKQHTRPNERMKK